MFLNYDYDNEDNYIIINEIINKYKKVSNVEETYKKKL